MNITRTTVIPPSGLEYCINTKSRLYGSNPFQYTIAMANGANIVAEGGTYQTVVRNIQFTNLIPNITRFSNAVAFIYNGTTYVGTLQVGNYTATTLLSSINALFATADVNLKLVYDTNFKLYSVSVPATNTFQWTRGTVSQQVRDDYQMHQGQYDRMLDILGFSYDARNNVTYAPGAVTGTFSARTPVNLFGTTFVDVTIQANLNCVHAAAVARQILVRIPVVTAYGYVVHYEPTYPISFTLDFQAVEALTVACYDEFGNPILDIPDNMSFNMQLLLTSLNANQ